jgi:hypothetical protein
MNSQTVASKAMNIAADMCVYTNHNFVTEHIQHDTASAAPAAAAAASEPISGAGGASTPASSSTGTASASSTAAPVMSASAREFKYHDMV